MYIDNNGVDYITKNNKEEQRITKYVSGEAVSLGQDSVLKGNISSGEDPTGKENFSSQQSILYPTPSVLDQNQVARCLVQLWDNGETSRQRYKLKVRLNLTDGSDIDFVAALTKDPRNFLKHTADKELARRWKNQSIRFVLDNFKVKPWLGKFHLVNGAYTSSFHTQVVEPNCFATAWWDEEAREWSATIMLYDFSLEEIDMQARNVTEAQNKKGCRSSRLWINPAHDQRPRALTWAEQRGMKNDK